MCVCFRELSDVEIESYLCVEMFYDCVGSAKSEGLGIVLLEFIDNDDFMVFIGLPLICMVRMLRVVGVLLL